MWIGLRGYKYFCKACIKLFALPEKPPWTSLRGKSSCSLRWCDTSCQSWSLCIFQTCCCCRFGWFLHFQLPEKKKKTKTTFSIFLLILLHVTSKCQVKLYLCDRIGSQHFVFNPSLTSRFAHNSKVPHSVTRRYGFSSSGFPAHNDGLVFMIPVGENQSIKFIYVAHFSNKVQSAFHHKKY